jgi:hypothetical protein
MNGGWCGGEDGKVREIVVEGKAGVWITSNDGGFDE